MTKIDKNVTKQFFKITFLVIIGLVGLSIITQLKRAIVNVNSGAMTVVESMKFLFSESPRTTVLLMPIATLLGAMMTMNNMAKTSEIIALKTSGISFKRIIRYPVIMAFIFALFTAILGDRVSTTGRRIKRELKEKANKSMYYSRNISENVYMRGKDGKYITHIATVYGDLGEIYKAVLIFQDEKGNLSKVISMDKALYDPYLKIWKGSNVFVKNLKDETEQTYTIKVISELKEVPEEFEKHKIYMDEINFFEIRKNALFLRATGGDAKDYILEMHRRIADPLLVFIISFFGFALGSRYVRGGVGISVAIGIVLGFSTYVVKSLSDAFVTGNYLSPQLGAWLPCIIFTIVSAITLSKAEY